MNGALSKLILDMLRVEIIICLNPIVWFSQFYFIRAFKAELLLGIIVFVSLLEIIHYFLICLEKD